MDTSKKRILVAGGAGYIGSRLVPALVEKGHTVEVIDLLWFGNHLPQDVKVTKKDLFLCNKEDFAGFDQIIFLAGLSNDPMAEFNPTKNFIYNGALPSYLAYEAKRAGVKRFIYASSCSVYGFTENQLYDEESPVVCDYPYGISKLQGERGVLQLKDNNFSVIALRQGTVCGYSSRMRTDLIVNAMFKTALTQNKIIVNNPDIWRPVYDINDCVQAYILAVQAEPELSGVFNVTSENITVGDVAVVVKDEVEKRLDKQEITIETKHIQDFRNYRVSTEKAVKQLGFKPVGNIKNIVNDLFAHRVDIGDLEDESYSNIKVFRNINFSF